MKPLFSLILLTSSLLVLSACNEKSAETTNAATSAPEVAKTINEAPAPATEESSSSSAPAEMSTEEKEASQLAYGHELHEDNCASCHKPEFYTREDRKVQDRAKLDSMVRACDAQLGTSLFDEDMELLANYLDKTYYKFSK
ncbi:MAG: Unknown protein [uncultured Thiotrichaceae bacterium]|uniref:Cytochrome c domain-containing protein n=1 Tax=uncultured Thiotrichaceae bacterium TaxID=298394 RepID=A0A6S6T5M7_9GAMM|nr:MAG: Unknown protein [uncultured Thiotrichaceae bacterium]